MQALKPKPFRPKGIALMLTLLIIMLVTIFITEFFFETGLEIRAMQNFRTTFVSQSLAKSMLKTVLVGLTERPEIEFFSTLEYLGEEIPIPDPNYLEYTLILKVRPIDHLYNLNRIQTTGSTRIPDSSEDRTNANQFVNLVSQIEIQPEPESDDPNAEPPEPIRLQTHEIMNLYANIFDWMDTKDDGAPYSNDVGVEGAENDAYLDFENDSELEIKNRRFDRLTELRLVKDIKESGLSWEIWEKHFTVYDVGVDADTGEVEPRLNVNLASYEEIVMFLKRFEQENSEYYSELGGPPQERLHLQDYAAHAEEIAEILTYEDDDSPLGDGGLANITKEVRYPNHQSILNDLGQLGVNAGSKFFFIFYSQWYEIKLFINSNDTQSEIYAVVFIPRNEEGEATADPTIVDFLIR